MKWSVPPIPSSHSFFKFVYFDQCVRNLGTLGKEIWSTRVPKDKKKMNRPLKALRPFSVALSIMKAKATKNAESKGISCFFFPHRFLFLAESDRTRRSDSKREQTCFATRFHCLLRSFVHFFFSPFPLLFFTARNNTSTYEKTTARRPNDQSKTPLSYLHAYHLSQCSGVVWWHS